MATITLVANTTYSALTVANNDIIALAGFTLTIDAQPAETGISIITPATAGKVVISGGYDLSTWSMTAGTATLVTTIPAGTELGSVTGGSASSSRGADTNNGTITTCIGGSGFLAVGCNANNATITTCTGGSGFLAFGCNANGGTITTCTGGSGTSAFGCSNNNATITTCTGGSTGGAGGCSINSGTITTCTGGSASTAYGCSLNSGTILKAFDDVELAISVSRGDFKLVIGPDFQTTISNPAGDITTIYSIGTLSGLATIPGGVTVITLSVGAGGGSTTHNPFRSRAFGG
jgi:hypothetical protein